MDNPCLSRALARAILASFCLLTLAGTVPGFGAASDTEEGPPGVPQNVTWERVEDDGRTPNNFILVSWEPPEGFPEGDADGWGYTFYWSVVSSEGGVGDEQAETLDHGSLSFELDWDPDGTEGYVFQVAAFNPYGEGERSVQQAVLPGAWPRCNIFSMSIHPPPQPPSYVLRPGCAIP